MTVLTNINEMTTRNGQGGKDAEEEVRVPVLFDKLVVCSSLILYCMLLNGVASKKEAKIAI